jgi:hypothetical protein
MERTITYGYPTWDHVAILVEKHVDHNGNISISPSQYIFIELCKNITLIQPIPAGAFHFWREPVQRCYEDVRPMDKKSAAFHKPPLHLRTTYCTDDDGDIWQGSEAVELVKI